MLLLFFYILNIYCLAPQSNTDKIYSTVMIQDHDNDSILSISESDTLSNRNSSDLSDKELDSDSDTNETVSPRAISKPIPITSPRRLNQKSASLGKPKTSSLERFKFKSSSLSRLKRTFSHSFQKGEISTSSISFSYNFLDEEIRSRDANIISDLKGTISKQVPTLNSSATQNEYKERREKINDLAEQQLESEISNLKKGFETWFIQNKIDKENRLKEHYNFSLSKRGKVVKELSSQINQIEDSINTLVTDNPNISNLEQIYLLVNASNEQGKEIEYFQKILSEKYSQVFNSSQSLFSEIQKKLSVLYDPKRSSNLNGLQSELQYLDDVLSESLPPTLDLLFLYFKQTTLSSSQKSFNQKIDLLLKLKNDKQSQNILKLSTQTQEKINLLHLNSSKNQVESILQVIKEETFFYPMLELKNKIEQGEDLSSVIKDSSKQADNHYLEFIEKKITDLTQSLKESKSKVRMLVTMSQWSENQLYANFHSMRGSVIDLIELIEKVESLNKQSSTLKRSAAFIAGNIPMPLKPRTPYRVFEDSKYKFNDKKRSLNNFLLKSFAPNKNKLEVLIPRQNTNYLSDKVQMSA